MAKGYKHHKRGSGGRRFVSIEHWIMDSEAWKACTCYARCLYLELCKKYNGKNNGEIYLSLNDAKNLIGASKPTAIKAFRELMAVGLIVCTQEGYLGSDGKGEANRYRLTAFDCDRRKATKEFASWKPNKI